MLLSAKKELLYLVRLVIIYQSDQHCNDVNEAKIVYKQNAHEFIQTYFEYVLHQNCKTSLYQQLYQA